MRTPLPIANGFYQSDSLPLSAQQCVNWYTNIVQAPALNEETLFGTPGSIQLTADPGTRQANRGADVLVDIPYFVNGTKLYRQERTIVGDLETFAVVDLGTIEGTGRVSIANNGVQICIMVPGGTAASPKKGYIFTASPDTLTEITDPDFRANGEPQHVDFVDGYFVFTTDSKKFIVSALNDGLAYNALDFGTAEADPDDTVAPMVFKNQLFIAGSQTTEAFQNIGGADFPFQRTGLFIQKGVSAPFSLINASNTFMWIGAGKREGPAIWRLEGNEAVKASTTAIDKLLQEVSDTDLAQVFAWSYAAKGAYFVGFALPTTTIVFDLVTSRWHERKSQVPDDDGIIQTTRSRVNSVVQAYGKVLVGDSQDGRTGSLDQTVYTEYGTNIIRPVATQPFQNSMGEFFVPYLELTMESGVGDATTPDPQIRMDRSLDGKTWKDTRSRSIGKMGEYGKRQIWRRCGRAKRFEIFRFTMSDPVKPVILQLTADIVAP